MSTSAFPFGFQWRAVLKVTGENRQTKPKNQKHYLRKKQKGGGEEEKCVPVPCQNLGFRPFHIQGKQCNFCHAIISKDLFKVSTRRRLDWLVIQFPNLHVMCVHFCSHPTDSMLRYKADALPLTYSSMYFDSVGPRPIQLYL